MALTHCEGEGAAAGVGAAAAVAAATAGANPAGGTAVAGARAAVGAAAGAAAAAGGTAVAGANPTGPAAGASPAAAAGASPAAGANPPPGATGAPASPAGEGANPTFTTSSADESFDPVAYINAPRWRHVSLGLGRMRTLAATLGNPQRGLRFVHVAGTNGKGSTCTYIASIAQAAGRRVGLFTSPYIEHFEERISVNGVPIGASELQDITLAVRDAASAVEADMGEHPTEFELMFAVALVYFARRRCDIVVVEVGLGGRLDATNIITPALSVIAPVSADHTAILGDTLAQIAAEKAGIIKPGVPVLSAPQAREVREVIRDRAFELDCPVSIAPANTARTLSLDVAAGTQTFEYMGATYKTRMLGAYQPANAALAIEAADILFGEGMGSRLCAGCAAGNHTPGGDFARILQQGVARAFIPGRFEVVGARPLTICDGAHNPAGATSLAQSLKALAAAVGIEPKFTFVLGVLADKDYGGIIGALATYIASAYVYAPDNPRALAACDLAACVAAAAPDASVAVCDSPAQAIKQARTDDTRPVIAAGTLYAIGEIKAHLPHLPRLPHFAEN